jgi:hypothetical protein
MHLPFLSNCILAKKGVGSNAISLVKFTAQAKKTWNNGTIRALAEYFTFRS